MLPKEKGLRRRDETRIDETRQGSYHVQYGTIFAFYDK